MFTLRSPSNRVEVCVLGTDALGVNDREWFLVLRSAVEAKLREVAHRPTRRQHDVQGDEVGPAVQPPSA